MIFLPPLQCIFSLTLYHWELPPVPKLISKLARSLAYRLVDYKPLKKRGVTMILTFSSEIQTREALSESLKGFT